MQTKLEIFDTAEFKSTIVCRRIIQRCLDAGNKHGKRTCEIISIKNIIQTETKLN